MTAATADERDRVGPYRLIQAIGAGGSARIDLARIDRAYGFQRHVVIKRPLEHLRGDRSVAASLRREARIGGRLRHPNLVAVLDAGTHDGYDYLALEYIHGSALRAVMQADAPGQVRQLPLGVALAIVAEVARGMHAAHELTDDTGDSLGLVHRDISPGNILVGLDGAVKLADFGIAKETRVSTLSGSMTGTVTYMAPEQCQGYAFDRRADIFSLGVILYELVTGARLFWADNDVASLHKVLSGTVPRPRTIAPQLPAALEDIVMTAVAHDAEQRFATALELAIAVEEFAVRTGCVLSARWIARAVEAAVGATPVPWLPTATSGLSPSADQSLVELIAALGEEPAELPFGDAGDTGRDDAAALAASADDQVTMSLPAVTQPTGELLDEPAQATQHPSPPRGPISLAPMSSLTAPPAVAAALATSRQAPLNIPIAGASPGNAAAPAVRAPDNLPRRRRPLVAIITAGAIIGAAVTTVVMTRTPDAPAALTSPATAPAPAAPAPATQAASSPTPSTIEPPAPPATADTTSTTPDAASTNPSAAPATASTIPSTMANAPTGPKQAGKRRHPSPHPTHEATAATSAPTAAPDSATTSTQPSPQPTNVEWKPSLLLPSDGAAKAPPPK